MRWLPWLLLLPAAAPAQVPAPVRGALRPRPSEAPETRMTGEFSLRGTVVDAATGEPVRKAIVRIHGGGSNPADGVTEADAGGGFSFRGLEAGSYSVMAEKPGYAPEASRRNLISQSVTVGPGLDTPPLRCKLVRQGILVGKVRDENSDPVPNAMVQAFRRVVRDGRGEWIPAGGQNTNDVGDYRMTVPPGSYLVAATHNNPPFFRTRGRRIGDDRPPLSYPTVYYPNVNDTQTAVPVVLASGQEQHADFNLAPGAVFQVHGRVLNAPPQRGIGLSLIPARGDAAMRRMGANIQELDGSFTFSGVAPGTYQLQAEFFEGPTEHMVGRRTVTVGESDLSGVEVTLAPAFDVPVQVRTDNDSQPPPMQVYLINDATHQMIPMTPDKNGSQGIRGLSPGAYRLGVSAGGSLYVKSATLGGVDILDRTLEWSGAAGPLEITLGSKGGTLSGHILNGSQPAGPSDVVVLRGTADGEFALARQVHAAGSDFTVSGLAPGNYLVLATEDVQNLEYADPAVLRRYQDYTQTVSVEEKAEQQLQLKLAPAP